MAKAALPSVLELLFALFVVMYVPDLTLAFLGPTETQAASNVTAGAPMTTAGREVGRRLGERSIYS
jgi:hypothetical protein